MKDNFQFSIFPGLAKRPLRLSEARSGAGNFQTISNFKFQISNSRAKRGFTFVELLVVISIIGILTSLLLVSFTYIQQQARNTQRKNDLKQYQTALENYASSNNSFYSTTTISSGDRASTVLCPKLGSFIAGCPEDPRNPDDSTFVYMYESDTPDDTTTTPIDYANALKWVLWAKLEGGTDKYWVICWNKGGREITDDGSGVRLGEECPL